MRVLMVRNPFGPYAKGDAIDDPALVAEIEAGADAPNVIPFNVPDPPAEPVEG